MQAKIVAKEALGGKGKRYKPHEIHIQRTQNKGYLVKHHLADEDGRPPMDGQRAELTYGLANHDELTKHLAEHFGPEASDDEEAEEEQEDESPEEDDEELEEEEEEDDDGEEANAEQNHSRRADILATAA